MGQAAVPAEGRVRHRPADPRDDHRSGLPARRGDRPGARGRAVRDQLRPDRAGPRGRVRGHVPQQRRPAAGRAGSTAGAGRTRPDPACGRVRVLRDGEPAARADPQTGGGRTAAVPADRSSSGDGRRLLGGRGLPQGGPARGCERVRARAHRGVEDGANGRSSAAGSSRPRASSGSSRTWIEACRCARTVCSRAPPGPRSSSPRTGRARRSPACRRACGPTSSACRSRRTPC